MQEPQPVRIAPVIIGMVLTIVLLVGLAYITNLRRDAVTTAPTLTIVSPGAGETLDSPLVIRFRSAQPIILRRAGWGVSNYHLHAHVNGVEHMPAAADIEYATGEYLWTIPAARRGAVNIRIGWADLQHRPLQSGASDTVHATLR